MPVRHRLVRRFIGSTIPLEEWEEVADFDTREEALKHIPNANWREV
jgi:hypothetical protein